MSHYRQWLSSTLEDLRNLVQSGIVSIQTSDVSIVINGRTHRIIGYQIADALSALDERLTRIEETGILERFENAKALK